MAQFVVQQLEDDLKVQLKRRAERRETSNISRA